MPKMAALTICWPTWMNTGTFLQHLRIHRAIVAVNDLAARSDDDRVRQRTRPLRIECFDEGIGTRIGVEKIQRAAALRRQQPLQPRRRHRVLLFQEFLHLRLQLGIVHRNRDHLEVAVAQPARKRDQFRKLGHARCAPSRPHVDQAEPVRIVFRELRHASRVDQ